LAAQRLRFGVLQFAIVIAHPDDVLLRDADDFHRRFLFGLADARQSLAGHLQVERAFVVVSVDDDDDLVAVAREHRQRSSTAEHVVIGMRREDHHRLAAPLFDPILSLKGDNSAGEKRQNEQAKSESFHRILSENPWVRIARERARLRSNGLTPKPGALPSDAYPGTIFIVFRASPTAA